MNVTSRMILLFCCLIPVCSVAFARNVDCTKYVFHQDCRGISAKRSPGSRYSRSESDASVMVEPEELPRLMEALMSSSKMAAPLMDPYKRSMVRKGRNWNTDYLQRQSISNYEDPDNGYSQLTDADYEQ